MSVFHCPGCGVPALMSFPKEDLLRCQKCLAYWRIQEMDFDDGGEAFPLSILALSDAYIRQALDFGKTVEQHLGGQP